MPVTREQFVQQLVASRLMTDGEVEVFVAALPAEPPAAQPEDGEPLAKELVRAGKLTRFQAGMVLRGKTKNLVLGDYVILDKLGAGGMGQVFKAHHRRLKRLVALKILPQAVMRNPDAVRRFQREMEAAARLTHPNIVVAHDASAASR